MKFLSAILCLFLVALLSCTMVSADLVECKYQTVLSTGTPGMSPEHWEQSKYQFQAIEKTTTHSSKSKGCSNVIGGQVKYNFMEADCYATEQGLTDAMADGYEAGHDWMFVKMGRTLAKVTAAVEVNSNLEDCIVL